MTRRELLAAAVTVPVAAKVTRARPTSTPPTSTPPALSFPRQAQMLDLTDDYFLDAISYAFQMRPSVI